MVILGTWPKVLSASSWAGLGIMGWHVGDMQVSWLTLTRVLVAIHGPLLVHAFVHKMSLAIESACRTVQESSSPPAGPQLTRSEPSHTLEMSESLQGYELALWLKATT